MVAVEQARQDAMSVGAALSLPIAVMLVATVFILGGLLEIITGGGGLRRG